MGLSDIFKKAAEFLDELVSEDNVIKGHDFERFVAEKFAANSKYFKILEWTADNHDKMAGIKVEANQNPDLVIEYIPSAEKFAVECKFRSQPFFNSKLNQYVIGWAQPYQIEHYRKFSRERRIPVFVVIGLGGDPSSPERLFCLPLEEARYPELFLDYLEKYEKEVKSGFFWRDRILR